MNNSKNIFLTILVTGLLPLFSACDRAPVQKIVNPTVYTNTWTSPVWVLYDDAVRTGGTIGMHTTLEGQSLDAAVRDNPHSGSQCFRFSWDGSEVTQYSTGLREYTFAGFSFIVADDTSKWDTTTKDLTPGGFTTLTMWVRGTLNSNVVVSVTAFSNTWNGTVSDTWQKISIPLTGASFSGAKEYVSVFLVYSPVSLSGRGNGGTVFMDDVQLEQ